MRNPWSFRILIIIAVLLWGGYTITPTLLQESIEERLSAQANEAESAANQASIQDKDDRIPEAEHLPASLKNYVLDNTRDCRSACKMYGEDNRMVV